jgi:hypothetical protein
VIAAALALAAASAARASAQSAPPAEPYFDAPASAYRPPLFGSPLETRTHPRWELVGPGTAVLLVPWVAHAVISGFIEIGLFGRGAGSYYAWGFLPIVGPIVQAGAFFPDEAAAAGYHAAIAVLEALGLALIIAGSAWTEEHTVVRDVSVQVRAGAGRLEIAGRF